MELLFVQRASCQKNTPKKSIERINHELSLSPGMTPEVYLASSSPRRRALLAQLGLNFDVLHPNVDESAVSGESAEQYVIRLAKEKARTGWQLLTQQGTNCRLVIGADTCIVLADDLIGKPSDKPHYEQIMTQLSGTIHQVYSAVAMAGHDPVSGANPAVKYRFSRSDVEFREISAQEREMYWQSGEPADKAGGYAIQGLAAAFVKNINGSYSGIVGLPLFETAELLREFGVNVVRVAP
jgi:septum formation protein